MKIADHRNQSDIAGQKINKFSNFLAAPLALATALILGGSLPASALRINLTYGDSVTQEQKKAAELAALIWEEYITDDIEVNIHLDMNELPWGKMGTAIPNLRTNISYSQFRSALAQKQNIDFLTDVEKNTEGYNLIQPDGTSGVNYDVMLTRANAELLGLGFSSKSKLGGYIVVNSRYNWSYKYAQGTVDRNKFDFTSVVIHEIGHNLGFISSIDPIGGNPNPTSLDMLRCSDYSAAQNSIDVSVTSQRRYFSIDGCQTVFTLTEAQQTTSKRGDIVYKTMNYEALFARGTDTTLGGDGMQASHWADNNPDAGIMNPLVESNTIRRITGVDLTAIDYIGYDVNYQNFYQTDVNGNYILDSNGNKIIKQLDWASLEYEAELRAYGDNYRPEYSPGANGNNTEVGKFMDESGIYLWWFGDGGSSGDGFW